MLFNFRATTMLFTCIVVGYLLSVGGVWGQQRLSTACFGSSPCSFMQLSCSNSSRIFIFKLLYGSKPSNSSCSGTLTCEPSCCQYEASDCFANYSNTAFALVYNYNECRNSKSCQSQALWGRTTCPGYYELSTYAVAEYSCLESEEITSFHLNTVINAPAVAIRYDSINVTNYTVANGDNQTWHCQVDTADCVQRRTDVILVKENYTGSSNSCSSVRWSGGPFLPCDPEFQYESFTTSTPFSVSVNVFQNQSQPNGWVAVRAQDGSSLVVRCGYTNGQLAVSSSCQDSSTAASITSPPTLQTTTSSATHADVTVSMTTSLTTATSSSITSEDKASGEEFKGAMVAGWVMAAVLAVLLAALVVLLLRRHGGCRGAIQVLRGKPSSHHPASAPRDQNADVNYLHVIPDPSQAAQQVRRVPTYVNAAPHQSGPDEEYVNAVAEQRRPVSQQEYSPLEWSRDQATPYSSLRTAQP